MSNEERIRELPAAADVDVLVAMSPENFTYVSGAYILTVLSVRPRQAFAVLPRKGEPAAVVCSIEQSTMADESWIRDVRTYTEFVDHPIDTLVDLLVERGLTRGRLGIDLAYLPQASYARLIARLPELEVVDTTDAVAAVRTYKSAEEVAILERAAKVTHRAIVEAMAASHLGETEKTMANRIVHGMVEGGAVGTDFVCFGSGERTRMPHAQPNGRVPRESEIIRFDVGARFSQWTSDMARTYSTGNPTAMQREVYRLLCEAQAATIGMIRPGVLAEDVYYACKEEFEKRGLTWWLPHVGHSFGIELHENPMLRPGERTPLAAGMVLNIEPFVFDDERIGYHTEDLLVVTGDGHRLLTYGLAPTELPVIGQAVATIVPGLAS